MRSRLLHLCRQPRGARFVSGDNLPAEHAGHAVPLNSGNKLSFFKMSMICFFMRLLTLVCDLLDFWVKIPCLTYATKGCLFFADFVEETLLARRSLPLFGHGNTDITALRLFTSLALLLLEIFMTLGLLRSFIAFFATSTERKDAKRSGERKPRPAGNSSRLRALHLCGVALGPRWQRAS